MKKKIMGVLENFSKAMVQPLMFLSSVGILIVLGFLLMFSEHEFHLKIRKSL